MNALWVSWWRKQEVQTSQMLQYFGTSGTGTIQGKTDFFTLTIIMSCDVPQAHQAVGMRGL